MLTKEVTRYGEEFNHISDVLQYSSDRTVGQYKTIRLHPMCKLGLSFIKLGLPDVIPQFSGADEEQVSITQAAFTPFWSRLVRNGLEQLDFGFKCMELLWEVRNLTYFDGEENIHSYSGTLPKLPKSLDGGTVEILVVEDDGSLRGFWQDSEEKRICLTKDRKALLFTNNLESGNFYGISELESIYPYWYDANINRQFHMRWLERKGTGIFKGSYPSGKSETATGEADNADIMLDLLNSIIEGVAVSIPSDTDENGNALWDIGLIEGQDKNNSFIEHQQYLDETILKGLVIPDKALVQGEVGARASIESFQSMFIQRKQDLLNQVVDIIDRYFVKNFVQLNFGTDAVINVKAGKLDDNSVYVANKVVQTLLEKDKISVDRQWLIDKTGIPIEEEEPEEEPVVESEEVTPAEEPEEEEVKEEDEKPEGGETQMAEMRYTNLNARERKYHLDEADTFLNTRSEQFKADITQELKYQNNRITEFVKQKYQNTADKATTIANDITISPSKIRGIVKGYIDDCYTYMFNLVQGTVENQREYSEKSQYIDFRYKLISDKMINDLETNVKAAASNGMMSGYSPAEVTQDINDVFTRYGTANLDRIANDEAGFALGRSNEDYFQINKKLVKNGTLPPAQAITRFQYSAVMDGVTTLLCQELNGMIVEAESPTMKKYSTPNHYNCRSIWLPITQGEINDPDYITDLSIDMSTGRPYTMDGLIATLPKKAVLQRTF